MLLYAAMLLHIGAASAHEAHVHGVGKLDIALDGPTLSLHLDSPLVNLIGFEHAARSAREQQSARDMTATLRQAADVFVMTQSAECKAVEVKLRSDALDPPLLGNVVSARQAEAAHHDGHADLDADFTFRCAHPERLATIDVRLFEQFKGFTRIDVQLVTARQQRAATLTPGSASVNVQ